MEKNKRDLMILIAILFIGFNYVIYTYYITYKLDTVKQAKNKYSLKTKELNSLKAKKKSIETKQQELKKLRQETSSFDSMVPTQIDTPQLIYDFYNGCKSFGVNGENISFELLNGDSSSSSNNFHTLIIDLKITGNKANIENFMRNLNTVTKRKLNVKSITIGSSDDEEVNNGELKSSDKEVSTDNSNKPVDNAKKNGDELPGEIIFYQYVQGSGNSNTKVPNSYIFYNSQKQGFNSIADMFK
ncbi:type 4a pilus biogenesis protein PilO [Clostridium autoethanogenum]|uniref:Type 4a pilus biogenesis protein PilO n=1 Tax=Clostridium autoethanogenum DSM 10061 TaxID=1341692 RepID=A0ABN4BLF8_9CLOT|nr:type 4a pilus biogenesis protein PilO [Clostridium autoethanogenum]AGY76856.1 type 4a pilus biogenesis protein PilO [Clostridium autoethanogenum DSM 10061]ALU37004.1 Pilus assembly protein PilO [Clostridium autoethanogenum DSM 10061]OVY48700.1 Pilus assembly protein, PilO [Clostridium autoethanogenum]